MGKIDINCNCSMIYKLGEKYKIVISYCKINCHNCILKKIMFKNISTILKYQ